MEQQNAPPFDPGRSLEELRRQLAQAGELMAILDRAEVAVLVRDVEDRVIYWNDGAHKLYGLSREQALGNVSHTLLKTVFSQPLRDIEAHLARTGSWQGELTHTSRQGGLLVVESHWSVRLDESGQPVSVLEVNQDVTQRKQAEQALRESEERHRGLFEDDLTGDYLATPEGRILACNPAFVGIFALPGREEALSANLADFFSEPEGLAAMVELVRREGKLQHHPSLRRRWDGVLIHVVENVVGSFDREGRLAQVKGYLFDNTARKLSEEELLKKDRELVRQMNKIEKLNAALSALLERREQEIRQKEEDIQAVVDKLVLPHLYDLKATNLDEDQLVHLEVMESNLKRATSSFARHLSTWKGRLTPGEIKVAELIRLGKSSKEIASLLRVSPHAVAFHRANLRAKLGLAGGRGNLASYLRHLV